METLYHIAVVHSLSPADFVINFHNEYYYTY